MARHAAARSPWLRRLLLGVAGLFGVAATVALGVLVSPDDLPAAAHRVPPVWATPTTTPPPSITAPSPASAALPTGPTDLELEKEAEALASREAIRAEADRIAAEKAAAEEAREAAQEAEEAREEAARSSSTPTSSSAPTSASRPSSTPEASVQAGGSVSVSVSGISPTPTSSLWSLWASDVQPQVAEIQAANPVGTIYTRPGHSPDQQHAADFMTSNQAKGDAIAAYALAMPGVEYVIWQQRYNDGSGWEQMEDRGGVTANHFDHVHVSFY